MRISSHPIWMDLFCAFLFVISFVIEFAMLDAFWKAKSAEYWPTTTGVVVHSELKSVFFGTGKEYEANIRYRYSVEREEFESSQVRSRGEKGQHKWDVAPLVDQFPVGSKVTVYYRPESPAESYLIVGADWINYVIVVTPLLFIFLSGNYFYSRFRGFWTGSASA